MSYNFYHNCLSPKLQKSISAQLKKLVPEQLALNSEVALHRERCKDLARRWSDAKEQIVFLEETMDPGIEKSKAIRTAHIIADGISQQMADALKIQKDLNVSASVVDSKSREVLNEQTIMMFLNAVMELTHEMFNDGSHAAIEQMHQFEDLLRSRVVIQKAKDDNLAVEGEIFAMLNTIPGPPELICE